MIKKTQTTKFIESKYVIIKEENLGYVNSDSELFNVNAKDELGNDISISFFKTDVKEVLKDGLVLRIKLTDKEGNPRDFKYSVEVPLEDGKSEYDYFTIDANTVLKFLNNVGIKETEVKKPVFNKLAMFKIN